MHQQTVKVLQRLLIPLAWAAAAGVLSAQSTGQAQPAQFQQLQQITLRAEAWTQVLFYNYGPAMAEGGPVAFGKPAGGLSPSPRQRHRTVRL